MIPRPRLVVLAVAGLLIAAGAGAAVAVSLWPSHGESVPPAPEEAGLGAAAAARPDYCAIFSQGSNPYLGRRPLATLREQLADSDRAGAALRMELHIRLAREELKFGNADGAIEILRAAMPGGPGPGRRHAGR